MSERATQALDNLVAALHDGHYSVAELCRGTVAEALAERDSLAAALTEANERLKREQRAADVESDELTRQAHEARAALTETQQELALEQRKNAWLHGIVFEHVGTDAANVDPDGYAALADVSGTEPPGASA